MDNGFSDTDTLQWLIDKISILISQANLIQLPGVVAAALSERRPPTSVGIHDHLRLACKKQLDIPVQQKNPLSLEDFKKPKLPIVLLQRTDPNALYVSAKSFFEGLRQILKDYKKSNPLAIAKRVENHCSAEATRVSSSVLLVGYWIAYKIRRGKGKPNQRHQAYARSSIERYLSSLSQVFQGMASSIDLLCLDGDEVTDLCSDMLMFHNLKQNDIHYLADRLQEFFEWASELGVTLPDWDELDLGNVKRSVRPGLFSESEYLDCLNYLLNMASPDPNRGIQAAFVVFLAYRFGLRAWEAIGMKRRDLCRSGELLWVLIDRNQHRDLKRSASSRRAVPLVFELHKIEQCLLKDVLADHDAIAGGNPNAPILFSVIDDEIMLTTAARMLPDDISKALKIVTGNPLMTLHHARHSFCNILASALFGLDTTLTQNLMIQHDPKTIREILLGTNLMPSRRSAMGVARAMGHQTPMTGFRSYIHCMTDWADKLTPVTNHYFSRIANAVQVRSWPSAELAHAPKASLVSQLRPLSPATNLRALRLFALGYRCDEAESMLRLEPGSLERLENLTNKVNGRLRFKAIDSETQKPTMIYGESYRNLLLKSRPTDIWPRLFQLVANLPTREALQLKTELPSLMLVSDLVGRNGHLLINNARHGNLIRLVIDLCNIPETCYKTVVRGKEKNRSRAIKILNIAGFKIDQNSTAQLDTFNADSIEDFSRFRAYGGLIASKVKDGPLHNSYEWAIIFIAVAAAYCPTTEILQARL